MVKPSVYYYNGDNTLEDYLKDFIKENKDIFPFNDEYYQKEKHKVMVSSLYIDVETNTCVRSVMTFEDFLKIAKSISFKYLKRPWIKENMPSNVYNLLNNLTIYTDKADIRFRPIYSDDYEELFMEIIIDRNFKAYGAVCFKQPKTLDEFKDGSIFNDEDRKACFKK